VIASAAYSVGGRRAPLFWSGMGFILASEKIGTVVKFWRKVAVVDAPEIGRMLAAVRERRGRKEANEGEGD